MTTQQARNDVGAVALGNSRKVHLIANLQQAVDLMARGHLLVLETKAPGIDQRSNGNVEGAVCLARDGLRQFVDFLIHGTGCHLLTTIDTGNG